MQKVKAESVHQIKGFTIFKNNITFSQAHTHVKILLPNLAANACFKFFFNKIIVARAFILRNGAAVIFFTTTAFAIILKIPKLSYCA
jgi:hypothetical protein